MVIVSPTPSLKVPAVDPASEPLIRICETSPSVTTMVLGVWRIVYTLPLCGAALPDATWFVRSVPLEGHGFEMLPTGLYPKLFVSTDPTPASVAPPPPPKRFPATRQSSELPS